MNTAKQVAQYILVLSNPEIGAITSNLKLQKLLYYAQGVHLAAFDTPLFEDEIVAWKFGPVVEKVYIDYKIHGSGAIPVPSSTKNHSFIDAFSKEKKDFIGNVYAYFGQYDALKLMQMTHEELPWKTTSASGMIPKEKMMSYFKTQPFVSTIAFPTKQQRLSNAALALLADYENDDELTIFTSIDSDPFYEPK